MDCALTFEELYALFDSREIAIKELEGTPMDQASGYGRAFAHSGGVAGAVAQALEEKGVTAEEFALNATPCSGIDECKMALLKMSKGIGGCNFIEGMACEGGCVQGAGILIRSPRNKVAVEKHTKEAQGRTIATALEQAE